VESTDVLQRIVRLHWFVIVVFVVFGIGVGAVVGGSGTPDYSSSARVALGTTTPQTQDEANAIASVARAIVTSPTQARDAIGVARVQRDPVDVADHKVTVQSLGLSNVVELTVNDHDRTVARALANALATELERTWLAIGHGQSPQVVADLNNRLEVLNTKIGDLDAQINSTVAPANGTDPVRTLLARREDLARQAVALESERDRLVSQDAADVRAEIIDKARVPGSPDTSGQMQALVLGGIAGLIAGLGVAALLEAMSPSLLGARRIAAAAGTIVLGRMRRLPASTDAGGDLVETATRLGLAARSAGVDTVELVGAPPFDVSTLVGAMRTVLVDGPDVRVFAVDADHTRCALVIVAPTRLRVRALAEVLDLPSLTGCAFLGVVTYDRSEPAAAPYGAATGAASAPAPAPESAPELASIRGEGRP
jgi:uncharacterized protein involved in exopolysaccharide biosynthesis